MYGGPGDDWYLVDSLTDYVGEYMNEGTDGVQATVSWVLGLNVEGLTLTGKSHWTELATISIIRSPEMRVRTV